MFRRDGRARRGWHAATAGLSLTYIRRAALDRSTTASRPAGRHGVVWGSTAAPRGRAAEPGARRRGLAARPHCNRLTCPFVGHQRRRCLDDGVVVNVCRPMIQRSIFFGHFSDQDVEKCAYIDKSYLLKTTRRHFIVTHISTNK